MDADVIVVGGGPGGSSAAFFLTRKGFSVLVLERSALPRYKACAGCVPAGGMELFPFSFTPVIEQHITRATFTYGQAAVTHQVPGNSLFTVRRDRFDWFLLQNSGAWIEPRTEVIRVEPDQKGLTVHCRDGRRFRAGYVIGADGPNSRVAASLNLRRGRRLGSALQYEIQADDRHLTLFRQRLVAGFGVLNQGYYWIFPKKDHLSIGIGNMHKGGAGLDATLRRIIEGFGLDLDHARRFGHTLPVHVRQEPLHSGNCLLVGDAAGLVDPLTGEGIRQAMESGRLAAEAISRGTIEGYSEAVSQHIGKDIRLGRRLADVFYARQRLCFDWLVRHRRIFRSMTRILSNRTTYGKTIAALPLLGLDFWNRQPLDS